MEKIIKKKGEYFTANEIKNLGDLFDFLEHVAKSTYMDDQKIEGNPKLEKEKKENLKQIEDIIEDVLKKDNIKYIKQYS